MHKFQLPPCFTYTPLWTNWFVLLSHCIVVSSSLSHTLCIIPPFLAPFVHPTLLHSLTFAPCLMHTPPFWAWVGVVHPTLLHSLTFAPCLMQTPPFWARFVHPTSLHNLTYFFFFVPCLMHTPPYITMFVHPSVEVEHIFLHLFWGAFFGGPSSTAENNRFLFAVTFNVDAASQGAVVAMKSVRVEVRRVVTTEFLFVSTAAAAAAVAASLLLCADYLDKSEEHNPPPPLLLPLMKQQQ